MSHYYAEINEINIVKAVLETNHRFDEIEFPFMIEIDSYDILLLGMLWDGNEFIPNPNPPTTPPSPIEEAKLILTHPDFDITDLEKDSIGLSLKALLKLNGLI